MNNVVKITSIADAQRQKDEDLGNNLSLQISQILWTIGNIIDTWAQQVENKEELKWLMDDVRAAVYSVLEHIIHVEAQHDLDTAFPKEISLWAEGSSIVNVDTNTHS